jgi:PKD repeat protein
MAIKRKQMKFLFLGLIYFYINPLYSQSIIDFNQDYHQRIISVNYQDSISIKTYFDKVGNIIQEVSTNPCYSRPIPLIAKSNPTICKGDSVKLTAPTSLRYKWSQGDTTQSIFVKTAGSYFVTTTNTFNCLKTSLPVNLIVTSLPKPKIIASGDSSFCKGESIQLTSSLTGSYSWNNGQTSKTITADSNKIYKLTYTDSNGCIGITTIPINVFPKPVAGFTISSNAQCLSNNSFNLTNNTSIASGIITYLWNFGDSNIDTSTSPKKVYANSGTYHIKLISTSKNGCKDSISKTATVYPIPTVSFTINKSAQCISNNNFTFTNTGSIPSGTLTHNWAFGDGKTSTNVSPSNTYASAGTYLVKLISTSAFGCKDSISKGDTVYYKPSVSFVINDASQCISDNNFIFTNNSTVTGSTLSSKWTFGDGRTSTSTNPTNSYTSPGTYSVKLISSSGFGCKDSITKQDTIFHKPSVNFTINDATQCISGNKFVFTNSSSIPSGTISSYKWTFGDGKGIIYSSTPANPTNVYSSAGNYAVKLICTSAFGCKDSLTKQDTVYYKPSVDFSINDVTQCVSGNNFVFTNGSAITGSTLIYKWTFGDGKSSTTTSPSNTYASAGTYSVKLIATSAYGCKDSISKGDTVYYKPTVSFSINDATQCVSGNNFVFTNGSTVSGSTLTHKWTFGDGKSSAASSPSNTYASAGTYLVKLISTSAFGCNDSIFKGDTVYNKPTVDFDINDATQCLSGNNFVFTNGTTVSGSTLTHKWTFGDGKSSTTTSPSNTYASAGTYSVKLISTSAFGCKDSISKGDTVYYKPTVDFSINDATQCVSGNNFIFTNGSTVIGSTLTHKWAFGDGKSSTTTDPSNTYATAGSYSVKLISTSAFGCKDSISKGDSVYHKPSAGFTINDATQCVSGNNFVFTNGSTVSGSTLTHNWAFGDGKTSTNVSPSNTYASAGTYLVKLISTSAFGCKDSISKGDTVYYKPSVSFVINDASQCISDNNFIFTNNSTVTGSTLSSKWTFGDGRTSTSTNPTNSYTSPGTYSVKLISSSGFGCKDSITKQDTIFHKPSVNFTINDATQCISGNKFVFTNSSSIPSGTISSYKWTFGDGKGIIYSSTPANPTNVYSSAGNYAVKLICTSAFGCKDSLTKQDTVYYKPSVDFSINDVTQCVSGNNFVFTNGSAITGSTLIYKWTFGDGKSSTTTSPSNTYASAGTYSVKLIATSAYGCKDSISKGDTVYYKPTVSFSINDATQCVSGNNFVFTNGSTVSGSTLTHKWTFGDGKSSAASSPSNTYASAGTYLVKLISTSAFGCNDSIFKGDTVYNKPTVDFDINDATQCLSGNNFVFTNGTTVSGSTLTHKWTFGDGKSSTTTSPSNTYASAGTYSVKLISTSAFGCKDSISKGDTVYYKPTVDFSINDTDQCFRGNNFIYTNTSNISSGSFTSLWKFGDDSISINKSPIHTYLISDKSYKVKLVSISAFGCKDSVTKSVVVYPHPKTAFVVDDSDQCFRGNKFVLTDSTKISSGTFTNFWRFGDDTTSTVKNPIHSYLITDTTFNVKLVTTSKFGCTDSLTKVMIVHPHPRTTFTVDDSGQCFRGNKFVLTDSTKISSGTFTNFWRFGDDTTSTLKNPIHSYLITDTTFNVKLVTTSKFGCTDSLTKVMIVHPHPRTTFTVDDSGQCFRGNKFVLTDSTKISSGTFTNFWRFGDDTTSTVKNPIHSYLITDTTFNVKLVTTSKFGCTDSLTKVMIVHPHPRTTFTVDDSGQCFRGNKFVLTDSTKISSGTFTNFWRFGDDTTSTLKNPIHSYLITDTTFNVKLVTTSKFGCTDSLTKVMIVHPHPRTTFTVDDSGQCFRGNKFVLTDSTKISSGTFTNFWRFGDDTTSTLKNPIHSYLITDTTFNVKLVTTSKFGCTDSLTKVMIVHPHPRTTFTVDDSGQCFRGNKFVLTDSTKISSGTFTNFWRFGDDTTSTLKNPIHSYLITDTTFNVKLVTTSKFGCTDSLTKVMIVHPHPRTTFTVDDSGQCFRGNKFVLTDSTKISSGTFTNFWRFGDDTTSTLKNPIHSYLITDTTFNVKLVTTSKFGCTDSLTKVMIVHPHPRTTFTVDDSGQCFRGNKFVLTDSTKISSGTFTNFWRFGDDTTSTLKNPIHSYLITDTTFNVKLVTTSKFGCTDSLTKVMIVHPHPRTTFTVDDSGQCFRGNKFVLTDSTKISSGTFTNFWRFGDDTTSTLKNPIHSYLITDTTFNVKLVTTSKFGCTDSLTKVMIVHPHPRTTFTVDDSGQCFRGNKFVLTDSTKISSGTFTNFWRFGDDTTSTLKNPIHSYLITDTTFNVKLVTTSKFGCTDSLTKVMIVHPHPRTTFTVDDSGQCFRGNKFVLTDSTKISSGTFTNFWRFGDDTTSTVKNPIHSYLITDTTFNVKLVTTSKFGCIDSLTKVMIVHPHPKTSFTVNDSEQCFQLNNFIFTDQSVISSGFYSNLWNLGDGYISPLKNITHQYTVAGFHKVQLITTSNYRCLDSASMVIKINPNPNTPKIVRNGGFLETDSNKVIQWFFNGVLMLGENNRILMANETGIFQSMVTNDFGCTQKSDSLNFEFNGSRELGIILHPNPNQGEFSFTSKIAIDKIEIVDNIGQIIYKKSFPDNTFTDLLKIELATGLYYIRFYATGIIENVKIIVHR